MDTKFTNSRESLDNARRAHTDWAGFTLAERIAAVELEGYVVIPNLLSAELIEKIVT